MSYPIDLKLKPSELMFGLFNYHNNHKFDGMDLSFTNPEPSNKVGFPDKVTVTSNTPIDGVDVAQALVHYTRIDINRLFSVCKLELLDKWLIPEIDMEAIIAAVLYRYGVNLSTGFAVHAVTNKAGGFALTAANSNTAYKGTANISIVKSLSVARVQVKALSGLYFSDGEVPEVELAPANWGASTKTIENYQLQDMPDMFSIVSVDRALTNVAASVGPMFGDVTTKLRSSVTGKRSWGFPARTNSPIIIGQQKDALPEATNDWTMLCYGEFGGKDVIVRGTETSEAGHKFTPAFGRGLMRELDNGNYLIVAGDEYGVTSWPSNKATVAQAPHHITLHPTKPIALECIGGKWYVNKLTDGNVAVVDRTELNNQMDVQVDTSNPANNVQVIGYDVAADAVYFSTKESIVKGEYGIWRVGSGKLISGKIEDADKVAELAASTHFLGTANSIFYNVGDGWGFKHMTYGDNV